MEASQIFLLVAIVASGIFVVQFVMTMFVGDVDIDLDGDTNMDTDMGSIVSFKGLVHFGIGFGWSMVLAGTQSAAAYALSCLVGLVFMVVLWQVYRLAHKLQKPTVQEPRENLVGRHARIYNNRGGGRYVVQVSINGALRETTVESASGKEDWPAGKDVGILALKDGVLYIE